MSRRDKRKNDLDLDSPKVDIDRASAFCEGEVDVRGVSPETHKELARGVRCTSEITWTTRIVVIILIGSRISEQATRLLRKAIATRPR